MNVRDRMREREKAKKFWDGLSYSERWELGDQLVLGDLDVLHWFDGRKPSGVFMNEVDYQRLLWESKEP